MAMTPDHASQSAGLPVGDLEAVYDELARAIDAAGPDRSELLLVKLALLNAQALGSEEVFRRQIEVALRDL